MTPDWVRKAKVGDKVVCTHYNLSEFKPDGEYEGAIFPTQNQVLTIRDIYPFTDAFGLVFEEISNAHVLPDGFGREASFDAVHFLPLEIGNLKLVDG